MRFKHYLIEQPKQPKQSRRSQIRTAIQQGQLDGDMVVDVRNDVRQIIRQHIKGDPDWKLNQWYNDLGLTYKGDDLQYADTTIDSIIGDIFGYFQDGPKNEITRVARYQKQVQGKDRTVYKVVPRKGKTQIQFFRVDQLEPHQPVLGVLIDNV